MNKNFKSYPRKSEIDTHGVDLVNYKGEVVDNYSTYTASRYTAYCVSKDNTARKHEHAAIRREYDRIKAENDFAIHAYNDACAMYDKIAAHNAAHPDDPIPQNRKPIKPKLKELPELHKPPRMNGLPMLRWYEVGKAPIANPA